MITSRSADRPQILLTGASGVLGSVVAAALAPLAEVSCLTRRRPVTVPGARSVAGDLTLPDLGLPARTVADLHARIDVVVHCGAMTAFTADGTAPERVNREGTDRILALAAGAGARLVHVSTAFVDRAEEFADRRPEGVPTTRPEGVPTTRPEGLPSAVRSPEHYLRSKIAAEQAVLASGLPVTIVRPSVLIGDSATGAIAAFQGWHRLCAGIITAELPFLPADGAALADFVPVDLAARAVAEIALAPDLAPGSEWWLTAGTSALTIDTTIDACLEVAGDHGLSPARPRTLPREMVERLVLPAFGHSAPPKLLTQMLEGMEMMRLFGSEHCFPRRWPTELGVAGPDSDLLETSMYASLDYLVDSLGLGRRTEVA